MAKWITAEKARAGQSYAVVCPNVVRRTKEMIAQSKRARAGWLTLVHYPHAARTFILRADVVLSFSGVMFVMFCFRIFGFTEAAALGLIVTRSLTCMRPDNHT